MRKDFVIEIDSRFGDTNLVITSRKAQQILSKVEKHWWRLVPSSVDIFVVGTKLKKIRECSMGQKANLSRITSETMQATMVNETIWLHHDPQYDLGGHIFILELLTMVGYAICHSPIFSCHLDKVFNGSKEIQEKYRVFACNFPYLLTPKGRLKLFEKIPHTFPKMVELENIVKSLP